MRHSHRSGAKMLEFKYTEGDQIVSFQTTLRGVHIDYYVEAFKCFLLALQFHPDNVRDALGEDNAGD